MCICVWTFNKTKQPARMNFLWFYFFHLSECSRPRARDLDLVLLRWSLIRPIISSSRLVSSRGLTGHGSSSNKSSMPGSVNVRPCLRSSSLHRSGGLRSLNLKALSLVRRPHAHAYATKCLMVVLVWSSFMMVVLVWYRTGMAHSSTLSSPGHKQSIC